MNTAIHTHIIDKAFYMPQLNRYRRIWLYLPPNYKTSGKRYPVLYMHDGQNLFDDQTAFSDEWCVDETITAAKEKCIVVGIDNGGMHRINEYSFHDTEHGKGEGGAYLSFIAHTLKPYIDTTYRTIPDAKHTGIAGSSMGGLISFYAGLYFPQVFGNIGVLSPSFWIMPDIHQEAQRELSKNPDVTQRYYFYAGVQEGHGMIKDVKEMIRLLKNFPHHSVKAKINPHGTHSEIHWRDHFPEFYQWWMMAYKLIRRQKQS
jgi:predicted alpha/beta superfamily hydrolase